MPKATVATMTTPSSCRKASWWRGAVRCCHAGVIGQGAEALPRRAVPRAPRSHRATRNRRCRSRSCAARGRRGAGAARVVLRLHGEAQVRPVEAVEENSRLPLEELAERCRRGSRRRRSRSGRWSGRRRGGARTSPRSAYSGRKSWPHCETQCASSMASSKRRRAQPLDRRSHGAGARARHRAGACGPRARRRDAPVLGRIVRRVEAARLDAEMPQRLDLVAHQRDQRRDDEGEAVAGERRKLEQSDLPAPVGMIASTSSPASTAATISSWPAR